MSKPFEVRCTLRMTEDLAALGVWLFIDFAIIASAQTRGKSEALGYGALYMKSIIVFGVK